MGQMISFEFAFFVFALAILYTYHAHRTSIEEKDRRDAECSYLARENEGLRLQLTFLSNRNEEIEHRAAETAAGTLVSRSIMAEQAEKIVQLLAQLHSMKSERNSLNLTIEQDRRTMADQSREISRLLGDLARAESKCRWKDEEIRTMGKDHETLKTACAGYETQVLELGDKLSECLTLLARSSRTGDWIKTAGVNPSLPPAYRESTSRRRAPTRKNSRPATDPNKSAFDYQVIGDSPGLQ